MFILTDKANRLVAVSRCEQNLTFCSVDSNSKDCDAEKKLDIGCDTFQSLVVKNEQFVAVVVLTNIWLGFVTLAADLSDLHLEKLCFTFGESNDIHGCVQGNRLLIICGNRWFSYDIDIQLSLTKPVGGVSELKTVSGLAGGELLAEDRIVSVTPASQKSSGVVVLLQNSRTGQCTVRWCGEEGGQVRTHWAMHFPHLVSVAASLDNLAEHNGVIFIGSQHSLWAVTSSGCVATLDLSSAQSAPRPHIAGLLHVTDPSRSAGSSELLVSCADSCYLHVCISADLGSILTTELHCSAFASTCVTPSHNFNAPVVLLPCCREMQLVDKLETGSWLIVGRHPLFGSQRLILSASDPAVAGESQLKGLQVDRLESIRQMAVVREGLISSNEPDQLLAACVDERSNSSMLHRVDRGHLLSSARTFALELDRADHSVRVVAAECLEGRSSGAAMPLVITSTSQSALFSARKPSGEWELREIPSSASGGSSTASGEATVALLELSPTCFAQVTGTSVVFLRIEADPAGDLIVASERKYSVAHLATGDATSTYFPESCVEGRSPSISRAEFEKALRAVDPRTGTKPPFVAQCAATLGPVLLLTSGHVLLLVRQSVDGAPPSVSMGVAAGQISTVSTCSVCGDRPVLAVGYWDRCEIRVMTLSDPAGTQSALATVHVIPLLSVPGDLCGRFSPTAHICLVPLSKGACSVLGVVSADREGQVTVHHLLHRSSKHRHILCHTFTVAGGVQSLRALAISSGVFVGGVAGSWLLTHEACTVDCGPLADGGSFPLVTWKCAAVVGALGAQSVFLLPPSDTAADASIGWAEAGTMDIHFGSLRTSRECDVLCASVRISGVVRQLIVSRTKDKAVVLLTDYSSSAKSSVVAVYGCCALDCMWSQVLSGCHSEGTWAVSAVIDFQPPTSFSRRSFVAGDFEKSRDCNYLTLIQKGSADSTINLSVCALTRIAGECRGGTLTCSPIAHTLVPAAKGAACLLVERLGKSLLVVTSGFDLAVVGWAELTGDQRGIRRTTLSTLCVGASSADSQRPIIGMCCLRGDAVVLSTAGVGIEVLQLRGDGRALPYQLQSVFVLRAEDALFTGLRGVSRLQSGPSGDSLLLHLVASNVRRGAQEGHFISVTLPVSSHQGAPSGSLHRLAQQRSDCTLSPLRMGKLSLVCASPSAPGKASVSDDFLVLNEWGIPVKLR